MGSEMGYVVALFGRVVSNALHAVWWSVSVVHTIGPHLDYYNQVVGRPYATIPVKIVFSKFAHVFGISDIYQMFAR